jgi:AcrR family transcriptional regulator
MRKNKGKNKCSEQTRKLFIDVLFDLIIEKGYDAVTIKDITERSALNRTTFYLYFNDKEQIVRLSLRELIDRLTVNTSAVERPGDEIELLFEHVQRHTREYRVLLHLEGNTLFKRSVHEYYRHKITGSLAGLSKVIRAGGGDENLIMSCLIGAIRAAIIFWLENAEKTGAESRERVPRDVRDFILNGLSSWVGQGDDIGS